MIIMMTMMKKNWMKMKMEKEMIEDEDENEDEDEDEDDDDDDDDRRRRAEKQTQTLTPDTYALSRTTLEITIGCLCRGPSKRFQSACRFSTRKKTCLTVRLFGQDGSNETVKKKRVHVSWSSQAVLKIAAFGARARQASANEPSGAQPFQRLLDQDRTWCARSWRAFRAGTCVVGLPAPFPTLARGEKSSGLRSRELPFATDREHAHPLQHVTAKVQSCQARCGCQSRRTDGLEALRLEIFVLGPPQRRARHVQRAVPTEHAQSLAFIEPLAQLGDVLHCPVSATTHCKSCTHESDQKNNSKTV